MTPPRPRPPVEVVLADGADEVVIGPFPNGVHVTPTTLTAPGQNGSCADVAVWDADSLGWRLALDSVPAGHTAFPDLTIRARKGTA